MLAAIASAALIVAGSLAVGQAVLAPLRPSRVELARGPGRPRAAAGRRGRRRGVRRPRPGAGGRPRGARRRPGSRRSRCSASRGACPGRRPPSAAIAALFAAVPVHRRRERRHPRRRARQRRHGLAPAARRLDHRALPPRAGADRPGLSRSDRTRSSPASAGCSGRARSTSSPGSCSRSRRSPRWSPTRPSTACGRSPGSRPRRWSRFRTSPPPTWPRRRSRSRSWPCSSSTFALLLARTREWRDAIPLGTLAAGVTYVYSFPGLAWLAGVALVWGLWRILELRRSGDGQRGLRSMDARTVRSKDAKRPRTAIPRRRCSPQRLASASSSS